MLNPSFPVFLYILSDPKKWNANRRKRPVLKKTKNCLAEILIPYHLLLSSYSLFYDWNPWDSSKILSFIHKGVQLPK